MNRIKIFDTTLRDGEQSPGCSMNLQEKIEVARQLEKLNVDVIEAGFAIASPMDFESVKQIAKTVKEVTVASLCRAVKNDIDSAYDAVKYANNPLIHTFIATSPIHMEYKLKMKPEQVLEQIEQMVGYARSLCPNVEFSAEDAMRSDMDFLAKAIELAIKKGATVVNIPDTVGYRTPQEVMEYITYIKNNVGNINEADISVHCHNDLGMAVSNSLAAIKCGATQVECTVNGIGERAGNASLEEVVMGITTRSDYYNATTNINTKQIYRTSKLISSIIGVAIPPNKAITGANAFAHEAGIHQHGVLANKETYEIMTPSSIGIPEQQMVLGKHSGRHAFEERLNSLGYQLEKEELNVLFNSFKELADKKKIVSDLDIISLLNNKEATQVNTYALEGFTINSGSTITATASVRVINEGNIIEKVAIGDGPIDAAFKAINAIVENKFVLNDYIIHAVTEGEDALGEAVVKLSLNGVQYTGRAISTDIMEASIKAYINGVNKHM
ncbi:MAG: 2-isopropylmalate synthase [Eubacteriales bacterium]|nr:2-isopropylmalate synthase [Eubacteriales bacterium]